jgi:hypothetical protein
MSNKLISGLVLAILSASFLCAPAFAVCQNIGPLLPGTHVQLQGPSTAPDGSAITWSWLVTNPSGKVLYEGGSPVTDYTSQNLIFDMPAEAITISLTTRSVDFPETCMAESCISITTSNYPCPLCTKEFCEKDPIVGPAYDGETPTCANTNPLVLKYTGPATSMNLEWYWQGTEILAYNGLTQATIDWSNTAVTNENPIPNPIPPGAYEIGFKAWAVGETEPTGYTCSRTIVKVAEPTAVITPVI